MKKIVLASLFAFSLIACENKVEEAKESNEIDSTLIQEVEESTKELHEEVQETSKEVDSLLNDI